MPHTAFVLAAGYGTRLRPLTAHLPKPLVPVCGVPMLAYALALCARHGLTDVVVNAHWLADALRPWAGEREGVRVTLSEERPDLLGTGGGLARVAPDLADRFVVVNADILCDVDLGALRDAVVPGGAAMAVRPSEDAERYGIVAVDAEGHIVRMRAVEVDGVPPIARDGHGTGLHALDRSVLGLLPEGFSDIVGDAYLDLVRSRRIRAIRHEGTWLDVGDPAAYLRANLAVLRGEVAVPLDPMPRAAWARNGRGRWGPADGGDGAAWVGPGAAVAGAHLVDAVVGARARVPAGTVLERCVVWEGIAVPAGVHRDTIFFPGGALAIGGHIR